MFKVQAEKCRGCGLCVQTCPHNAITLINGQAWIDSSQCNNCGLCLSACPLGAIEMKASSEFEELKNRIQYLQYQMQKLNERLSYLELKK